MSNIDPTVYIRRNKLRRIFAQEFDKINDRINAACKAAGSDISFHVKYSSHLLDRAIQREIDEQYVFDLFNKLPTHVGKVIEFLQLPATPDIESELDENVNYRPLRLEITDGNLWLGMTVNKFEGTTNLNNYGLCCRMAFVNNRRLKGKISTEVIYL